MLHLRKTNIWINLKTLTAELELRAPLTGAVAAGLSGTVDEKLQHPGIIRKHDNSLHETKENMKHFKDDSGRWMIVSKMRELHLVEVAADQPQLGPKLPCPCPYWAPPFPSSLPQNLSSLSLSTSKPFALTSDVCSLFQEWCVWTEKSGYWCRTSTVQLSCMSWKMAQLTYDWFFCNVCERLGIARASQAAGQVEINKVLHRINLLVVWRSQHSLIKFNKQNNLGNVCLLFFLKTEERSCNYIKWVF